MISDNYLRCIEITRKTVLIRNADMIEFVALSWKIVILAWSYVYIRAYIHTYISTYLYTCIHIHTFHYTHPHTHTQIRTHEFLWTCPRLCLCPYRQTDRHVLAHHTLGTKQHHTMRVLCMVNRSLKQSSKKSLHIVFI